MRLIKKPLVLDKSYAQAVKKDVLLAQNAERHFLVPSAFYQETLKNDLRKRCSTIKGVDEFERIHIPKYLRFERRFGKPSHLTRLRRLYFNPSVLSRDWSLADSASALIARYQIEVVDPQRHFLESVIEHGVIGFSDDQMALVRGSNEVVFVSICNALRDRERIRWMAAQMGYPHATKFDESWFYFRRIQALALQGLILCHRFPRKDSVRGIEFVRDLEHDVLDLEYLTLGLVVGSLATNETGSLKMAWRFKLLAPEGELLTQQSLSLSN